MTASVSHPPRAPARALEVLRVNIIVERARARLSQADLAERAGVARPTISRIERAVGDVGIDVVQRIADALGVTVASLFVPPSATRIDDDELARRSEAPPDEFGDVRDLLGALDENNEAAAANPRGASKSAPLRRYSNAGRRPAVER